MPAVAFKVSEPSLRDAAIPPLENGDRLTRAEFERRYHAMPGVKKAELIEGIVYMPSPVRIQNHGTPHFKLSNWIGNYEEETPGTQGADNSTVRLDLDNEPQPDVLLRIVTEAGGSSWISEDDYLEGSPEFTAEVASSSASYDCHAKKNAYRRNGVREYLIWLVRENRLEWWRLVEGEYLPLEPQNGIYRSEVFPGLWLDGEALLQADWKRVRETLAQGIASPEHAAFVEELRDRMRDSP
jgi:Uma2 family endonuclease